MRRKKNQLNQQPNNNELQIQNESFINWDKDLGFLNLVLLRKKNITKNFLIDIYNNQKSEKDYIQDEEIEPIISQIVFETIELLSPKYKTFIIEKYFGSEENLIKFISEDVYVDLTAYTISKNMEKITKNLQAQAVRVLSSSLNKNNKGKN